MENRYTLIYFPPSEGYYAVTDSLAEDMEIGFFDTEEEAKDFLEKRMTRDKLLI